MMISTPVAMSFQQLASGDLRHITGYSLLKRAWWNVALLYGLMAFVLAALTSAASAFLFFSLGEAPLAVYAYFVVTSVAFNSWLLLQYIKHGHYLVEIPGGFFARHGIRSAYTEQRFYDDEGYLARFDGLSLDAYYDTPFWDVFDFSHLALVYHLDPPSRHFSFKSIVVAGDRRYADSLIRKQSGL